jgi:hypothetical protein
MEPSGRNRWQPVADGMTPRTAQAAQIVAVGCDRLPESFDGKEGVDGSSPSEGLKKGPHIAGLCHNEGAGSLLADTFRTATSRARRG